MKINPKNSYKESGMHKPKHQLTNRAQKKMNKEVRSSAIQPDPIKRSNDIKAEDLLSRYPKKIQKKEESFLKSINKNIAIKKKKETSPHSKRTAPGLVDETSPPHIIHVEGRRWIKTAEQQILAKNKISTRRTLKKKR
jgi:hypothetical protein